MPHRCAYCFRRCFRRGRFAGAGAGNTGGGCRVCKPTTHFNPEAVIETLTPKQRAHLKSLAHPLKPVLHVGKEGVTEAAVRALVEVFNTRELAKVKVLETAPEGVRGTGDVLAARLDGAQVVQVIGRIVVLYRPHPDRPKIELPRART